MAVPNDGRPAPEPRGRTLRWKGYRVHHVINVTDVGQLTSDADVGDDKLEVAARREHRSIWEIAEHYTEALKTDLARLRVGEPDLWPKATDHIPQMIAFAESLDRADWCYVLPSGLYFDTSRDDDYGKLARLDVEGQLERARIEAVEGKRNASDFAVWRTADPAAKRQMEWASPWGRGVPGWHLECSVMSIEHLGRHFDIHTGGIDHIPIHHTNEIAQSEAYLDDGEDWVRWWLHGEFINLKGAKISKSTGGAVRVDDLLDRGYHPLVYRYLLLQAHYRSQIEFSWQALDSARTGLRRLLGRYAAALTAHAAISSDAARAHLDAFDAAVSDDLNTAKAGDRDEASRARGDDYNANDRVNSMPLPSTDGDDHQDQSPTNGPAANATISMPSRAPGNATSQVHFRTVHTSAQTERPSLCRRQSGRGPPRERQP